MRLSNAPTALPRAKLREPVRGEVIYENVSFGYSPERVVLRNISLHARPGEMIALVGPTGAGKSTLVNLLPAFYEAGAGRITIDGQDISGITLESLRAQISVVSQEAFLFNGTIRENILYGRLDATEEELVAASQAANCHEFITQLPDGYDSRVGERGVKLSVGEKQRVSIARALLKNAPILDPGRGHRQRGYRHRTAHPGSARTAHGQPHQLRHRTSPEHHPQGGPDPGGAPWPDHRARHAR